MKLTNWFPGYIKPVRVGVYQQLNGSGKLGYQYWDGVRWHSWATLPELATDTCFWAAEFYQNDSWRGLAQEPKP